MDSLILALHVVVCFALILLVLLQSGKEGMGVIFGGGSQSMFGSGGAGSMLSKLTAFLAILFFVTSLGYNVMSNQKVSGESNILDVQIEESTQPKPVMIEDAAPKETPEEK